MMFLRERLISQAASAETLSSDAMIVQGLFRCGAARSCWLEPLTSPAVLRRFPTAAPRRRARKPGSAGSALSAYSSTVRRLPSGDPSSSAMSVILLNGRHVWDYKAAVTLMAAYGVYCCWKASSTMADSPLLCWQTVSRRSKRRSPSSRLGEQPRGEGSQVGDCEVERVRRCGNAFAGALYESARSPWATAARRSQGWAATISVRRGSSASRRARAGTRRGQSGTYRNSPDPA